MNTQTFDLNKMGVVPLDSKEEITIEGGNFWWAVGVGIYLYDNRGRVWEGIKKGVSDIFS